MSIVGNDPTARDILRKQSLFDLLSNHLVLQHTAPYLSARDRLALGATCKDFCGLIQHAPGVFRYLDLTRVTTAQFDIAPIDNGGEVWRNVQVDEHVTEDDFYSGPLRGIFSTLQRRHLLNDVQTLVLDGLSVTADLCHELINDPKFNVRILSIRGVKHLNERSLRKALRYACRPSRQIGTPKLRGLYIFTSKSPDATVTAQDSAESDYKDARVNTGDLWYGEKGRVIQHQPSQEWAETLIDCQGVIAFDAPLCTGPCHMNSPSYGSLLSPAGPQWAVASFALSGCVGCGSAPEGLTTFDTAADRTSLPLLPDVPFLSSSLTAATYPMTTSACGTAPSFVARCATCLNDRHCRTCNKWWCEKCYTPPQPGLHMADESQAPIKKFHRSCFECGFNCNDCISRTQKTCTACGGGYCIVHHEGSSSTLCDWCSQRRRQMSAAQRSPPRAVPQHPQQMPGCKTRSKQAWITWMRNQNSISERRARERTFPREGMRCLTARS
ncbi:hypothetical protein jhhlp_001657 [Lomentospora prolificans]|uniref:F-box domain-containing protein n=1 Tax=Lomentospora prolificans TaxID=41688 RepID=A0A2N3NIT7_9PEZI|nr:hypothetical protein jhhlp_001657 [Lomentospora prolificans]